jgi:hypothetical protein
MADSGRGRGGFGRGRGGDRGRGRRGGRRGTRKDEEKDWYVHPLRVLAHLEPTTAISGSPSPSSVVL